MAENFFLPEKFIHDALPSHGFIETSPPRLLNVIMRRGGLLALPINKTIIEMLAELGDIGMRNRRD
jgi:hypothetical protein